MRSGGESAGARRSRPRHSERTLSCGPRAYHTPVKNSVNREFGPSHSSKKIHRPVTVRLEPCIADTKRAPVRTGARSWRLGRRNAYPIVAALRGPVEGRERCASVGDATRKRSGESIAVPAGGSRTQALNTSRGLVCSLCRVAQPVENQLVRPMKRPPSDRRACRARWSSVVHRLPSSLLWDFVGCLADSRTVCPTPHSHPE